MSGDRVTSLQSFWKVPETFRRARTKQNFLSITGTVLGIGLIGTLGFFGIRLLVDATRKHTLPWARAIRYGLLIAGLGFVGSLMNLAQIYRAYDTAVPLRTFQTISYVGLFMSAVVQALLFCSSVAVLFCLEPDFPEWLAPSNRRPAALNALLLTATAAALAAGLYKLNAVLLVAFPCLCPAANQQPAAHRKRLPSPVGNSRSCNQNGYGACRPCSGVTDRTNSLVAPALAGNRSRSAGAGRNTARRDPHTWGVSPGLYGASGAGGSSRRDVRLLLQA